MWWAVNIQSRFQSHTHIWKCPCFHVTSGKHFPSSSCFSVSVLIDTIFEPLPGFRKPHSLSCSRPHSTVFHCLVSFSLICPLKCYPSGSSFGNPFSWCFLYTLTWTITVWATAPTIILLPMSLMFVLPPMELPAFRTTPLGQHLDIQTERVQTKLLIPQRQLPYSTISYLRKWQPSLPGSSSQESMINP